MNQNNHGQSRRNSASYNRHTHGNNHSGRSNHAHTHQRWPSRYSKDYRDYDSCFTHGDCIVGTNSTSPKDSNFMNHHGYPKPPQLSPNTRTNHVMYANEASGTQDWRHMSHSSSLQDRRHVSGPGSSQHQHAAERRPTLTNGHGSERRQFGPVGLNLSDRRHISPPLHINICDNTPTLHHQLSPVSSQSDGLSHGRNSISIDYTQRRNGRELRVSPVHLQHSPSFYRQSSSEDTIKSESPSRKRRRLSRSGHHQIVEINSQSASPPHTHQHQHRRSPRQHQSSSNNIQGSMPVRHYRYQDRTVWTTDELRAHSFLLPNSTPVTTHTPLSPVMMDINQVPVSLPMGPDAVWTYSPQHICVCQGPAAPPHVHPCHMQNIYPPPFTGNYSLVPSSAPFGSSIGNHGPSHFGGFPPAPPNTIPVPPSAQHYPHTHMHPHQHISTQHADGLDIGILDDPHGTGLHMSPLQVSSQSQLFISEPRVPHSEMLHLRNRRMTAPPSARRIHTSRARWHTPMQLPTPTSSYPSFLFHFLTMFSTPPLTSPSFTQTEMPAGDNAETENYEALLSLAERLGEAKSRGLAKPEIEQLLSYKFDKETHNGGQTSCVVCMCDFEAKQLIRVLPCIHEFHVKCIDKWLRSNRTCPICRGNVSDFINSPE